MSSINFEKLRVLSKSTQLETSLANKTIAFYFSAHWCPPCRAFTPLLIKAYNDAIAAGMQFECIFVSSDRTQTEFDNYYETHPWCAIPFDHYLITTTLKKEFEIRGIPELVVVSPKGKIITKSGREDVMKSGSKAIINWCNKK